MIRRIILATVTTALFATPALAQSSMAPASAMAPMASPMASPMAPAKPAAIVKPAVQTTSMKPAPVVHHTAAIKTKMAVKPHAPAKPVLLHKVVHHTTVKPVVKKPTAS